MPLPQPSDYKAITTALLKRAAAAGLPTSGSFELTSRCNLACRMCYIRHEANDAAVRERELSAAEWVRLAEQGAAAGMLFLLLTGGEVFLRPDFLDLYLPLTQLGLNLCVFTNGTLVTPALAQALGRRPPNRTEITLYGASPETYGRVTGHPEAFAQAIRGLDLLREAGLTLAVKATLTRRNVHDLEAIRELAHARDLPLKTGWLLTCRPDGAPSEVYEDRLSPEEVLALEQTDEPTRKQWQGAREKKLPPPPEGMVCMAGKTTFAVNPRGEMSPCADLTQPAVKPLEIGFAAAWDQVRAYVLTVPPTPACRECDVAAYCNSCPAHQLLETGSMTTPDPYRCAIAHLRREAFTVA